MYSDKLVVTDGKLLLLVMRSCRRDKLLSLVSIANSDEDSEVDLTSEAYQIWKNAIDADSSLKKKIENLPPVVYSTRAHTPTATHPEGVLIYMKTPEGNDSLALIDRQGRSVTQSQPQSPT